MAGVENWFSHAILHQTVHAVFQPAASFRFHLAHKIITGKTFAFPVLQPEKAALCLSVHTRSGRVDVMKLQLRNVRNMIVTHATIPTARMEPDNRMA